MLDKDRMDLIIKSSVINDDICHVSDHLPLYTVMKCELLEYHLNESRMLLEISAAMNNFHYTGPH